MSSRVGVALALAVAIAVIAVVVTRPDGVPVATPVSPSPTATATVAATPTASPTEAASPTPTPAASPTPASGRFISTTFGYSIELTGAWHWSDCASGTFGSGDQIMGHDLFVTIPAYDFSATGTGIPHDHISVAARLNPEGLSPRQWYETRGLPQGSRAPASDITFAGRPAVRVSEGDFEAYVVSQDGRIFEITGNPVTGENTAQERSAVMASFRFLSADQLASARAAATASPQPPRSPEEVADILAEGFAKKDVAILATVITPSCVSLGVNQGGGSAIDDRRYLDELADRFREGLVVDVRPRPITGERTGDLPTVVIQSTWRDPRNPDLEVDLMISPEGQRWYWRGNIAFLSGRT